MNKYLKLTLGIIATVAVFAGIFVLYNTLSSYYTPDTPLTLTNNSTKNDTETNNVPQSSDDADAAEAESGIHDENADPEVSDDAQSYMAPDFSVVDMDGNIVKLSDYVGKPVVVNFWASWCPPCKAEMPDFEQMYKQCADKVQFMMINLTGGRETVESAKEFISDSGYSFPIFFDTESEAAINYGVSAIPMTCFINDKGELVAYANAMIDLQTLKSGLELIGVKVE